MRTLSLILSLLVSADGDLPPPLRTRAAFVALCDAVSADDKSGAWDCLKGDGTMASGSATTWVATGSPTNTTENGWPVRTYTNVQNDQQPANAAFPASDFSICIHHRSSSIANVQLAAFGLGAAATTSSLPFELQTNGGLIAYVSDGTAFSPGVTTSAGVVTAGAWAFICYTYVRTGGAGNNVGTIYVNGVQSATISTHRLAQGVSSKWSSNGVVGGGTGNAKSIRGVFVTYKALTAPDVARIYARLGP